MYPIRHAYVHLSINFHENNPFIKDSPYIFQLFLSILVII